MSYKGHLSLAIFAILMSANFVSMAASKAINACQVLSTSKQVKEILPQPSQIIIVKSLGGIKANMTLCQRHGTMWKSKLTPFFSAVIGKNGMASIGEKKEGDSKTPAGLFPIGEAFGTEPLALKMDYKYITVDDKFIDDVNNKRYKRLKT